MEAFIQWWQHLPSQMNPIIFSVGSFAIRWYGTMYIVAFALTYFLVQYRITHDKLRYPRDFAADAIMWAIVGVILGGRLGYVFFYDFRMLIQDPIHIFLPFREGRFVGISGMSYHGGLIGVIIAWILFARKHQMHFFHVADLFAPAIPLGYTFGRIGNFINGELYGRVTEAAIGMYFPNAGDNLLRHPSQLYEAFFEGIFLFFVLWLLRKKTPFLGFLSGMYVFGYGFVRFFIEYFREPDAHLGFVFLQFSMGQMLCLGMMGVAIGMWMWGRRVEAKGS
ncbi:MAG: prolipoprotein diacylglyceryl transferase [Gemmatimonadetes bacterium]|nr:MAG: prolipoprotein diacylglyceryl transferase [Gemmatimonadota bacterium]